MGVVRRVNGYMIANEKLKENNIFGRRYFYPLKLK